MATLYAEQGEFAKAIALWRQLTASPAVPGPAAAYLYSNLGYAYLLSGDSEQAVGPLERACILDPLGHRAWRHLGDALAKMGQDDRARIMYQQAGALEAHDFKADYVLAQRSGGAAIDRAVAPGAASTGMVASELHQAANGVFELRRTSGVGAAPLVVPAAARASTEPMPLPAIGTVALDASPGSEPAAPASTDRARLEICNGNGVAGMARKVARSLRRKPGDAGLRVVRLSNEKGFKVEQTRVEYQQGFRAAATRLAERFANATVLEVASGQSADVRLVIGRDLVRSQVEARRIIKAALVRAARAG